MIFFSNFSPSTMNQNAKIMYVVVHGVTPIFFSFLPTVVFCCAHGEKNLLTVFFLIVERYIVYVLLFYTFFIYKGARIKICCEKKKIREIKINKHTTFCNILIYITKYFQRLLRKSCLKYLVAPNLKKYIYMTIVMSRILP